MARKGESKDQSIVHETFIARTYGGNRNRGSGALDTETGDVITTRCAFECKTTGSPKLCQHEISWHDCEECYRKPTMVARMEKIVDEAREVGRFGALALRFYDPKSPLADFNGFVDLVVFRVADDVGIDA